MNGWEFGDDWRWIHYVDFFFSQDCKCASLFENRIYFFLGNLERLDAGVYVMCLKMFLIWVTSKWWGCNNGS
jgi:hypothetical protein